MPETSGTALILFALQRHMTVMDANEILLDHHSRHLLDPLDRKRR